MKTGTLVAVVAALIVGTASVCRAQDPTKVDPAHYKVVLENPSVRVLRITYPAGAKSKMHQHPDSMVVVLSSGKMTFATPDGKTEDRELPKGSAMFTPAGTHLPSNTGTAAMDAILIEFKTPQPGTATLPTNRENATIKTLAESPRANAYLITFDPKFQEPAGTTHDYDQVVIAIEPNQMSLSVDGKPAKTNWKAGDVAYIGRGVPHESKDMSTKPQRAVIVAIK